MLPLLPFAQTNDMWYAVPLIVVVSLVYAATRHEEPVPILHHASRVAAWVTGFMAIIFVALKLIFRDL